MQLTLLVSSTQRRGAEVFASQLAASLPARGWNVDFVALADRPANVSSNVPAHPLSDLAPADLGRLDFDVVRSLRSRLSARGSRLVLANGSSTLQYGVAAVRTLRHRPRLAYASIGEPLYWAGDLRRRLTYRAMLTLVDSVFSVSAGTARQLTDRLGVPPRKLTVLHTGVPERFLDIAAHAERSGPLRVLFAGSLSDEKNPMAALSIVTHLAPDTPAILRFIGAGPLEDETQAAASQSELAEHVEFAGSVPDPAPHFAWADVLLLTSKTEGLPGVVLEAAAAGLPVVAFDVGGVAETVQDGITGVLVEAGDVEGAAAGLARLAADPQFRQAAGQAGRAMVEERFTMSSAIDRYDFALRAMLTERESP